MAKSKFKYLTLNPINKGGIEGWKELWTQVSKEVSKEVKKGIEEGIKKIDPDKNFGNELGFNISLGYRGSNLSYVIGFSASNIDCSQIGYFEKTLDGCRCSESSIGSAEGFSLNKFIDTVKRHPIYLRDDENGQTIDI